MPLFGNRKQNTAEKRDVSRFFSLNIGTIVFGAILVYILVSLILFLTQRHVQYYQVTSGPLTKNQTHTGIALRSEQLITTDTGGYVTYYAQGDARVRRGGMLFGIILILIWRQQSKNKFYFGPRKKKKKFYTSYSEPSQGRVVSDEEYNYNKKQMEDKLDAILDKISKSGYDSLSKEEKDFLFFSSKRKNNE